MAILDFVAPTVVDVNGEVLKLCEVWSVDWVVGDGSSEKE